MSFTYIGCAYKEDTSYGATTTLSALDVAAGDVLIIWVAYEGGSCTVAASDGGSNSFTMEAETKSASMKNYGRFGVVLNASANSSAACSVSFNPTVGYREVCVMQFRPSSGATVSKDAANTGTGSGSSHASGTITTTGTDEIVVGASKCYAGGTWSSPTIGGTAADESQVVSPYAAMWCRILSATASNIAAAVTGPSGEFVCNIFSVKATAAATSAPSPLATLGVG